MRSDCTRTRYLLHRDQTVPKWYAVYTFPRHEKKVSAALELKGIETFLPLYREVHRWRNGLKKEIDLPLFPGYVFVHFNLQERLRVLETPSVATLVGAGSEPCPLPDAEMTSLRLAIPQLRAEPHPFIKLGDRVRVKAGPLAGLEGILIKKKESWRFVICMDLIRQAVSVEIDATDIEPVSSFRLSPHEYGYSA